MKRFTRQCHHLKVRLNLDGTGLQKHRQAKRNNDSAATLSIQKDIDAGICT
jgi:hypothetical protein